MLKTIAEYEAEKAEERREDLKTGLLCPDCEADELWWDTYHDSMRYTPGKRWAHCRLCEWFGQVSA